MAAKVVLTLVGSFPVQKVDLEQCPDDLDELDDAVLDLTRGKAYTMTVAGATFSDAAFQACKAKGEKIVVHVHLVEANASPPPTAADSKTERTTATGPAHVVLSEQNLKQLESGVLQICHAAQSAEQKVCRGNSNLLIRAMDQEFTAYKDFEHKARCLVEFDPDLGRDVTELIQSMTTTFGNGLTEIATTRRTIVTIHMLGGEMSRAFAEGRLRDAKRFMTKMGSFVGKMEELSAAYAQKLDADKQEWNTRLNRYKRTEEDCLERLNTWSHRTCVAFAAGVAGVAGSAGFACFAGVAASAGFAELAGFAAACSLMSFKGSELLSLVAFGSCAACAAINETAARRCRVAHESAEGFAAVVEMAAGATENQQELWACIAGHLTDSSKAFEDASTMGVDDRVFIASKFAEFAKSVVSLIRSLDEYLVFVSERQFFPGTFPIRGNILDAKTYDEIKLLMELAAEEPTNPRSANSMSSPSTVAVVRTEPNSYGPDPESLDSFIFIERQ